jgi:hypothetical protein
MPALCHFDSEGGDSVIKIIEVALGLEPDKACPVSIIRTLYLAFV